MRGWPPPCELLADPALTAAPSRLRPHKQKPPHQAGVLMLRAAAAAPGQKFSVKPILTRL